MAAGVLSTAGKAAAAALAAASRDGAEEDGGGWGDADGAGRLSVRSRIAELESLLVKAQVREERVAEPLALLQTCLGVI